LDLRALLDASPFRGMVRAVIDDGRRSEPFKYFLPSLIVGSSKRLNVDGKAMLKRQFVSGPPWRENSSRDGGSSRLSGSRMCGSESEGVAVKLTKIEVKEWNKGCCKYLESSGGVTSDSITAVSRFLHRASEEEEARGQIPKAQEFFSKLNSRMSLRLGRFSR
jgi:hypothetical protein